MTLILTQDDLNRFRSVVKAAETITTKAKADDLLNRNSIDYGKKVQEITAKKEAILAQKAAEAEERNQRLDAEEAAVRAASRKEAIDRAHELLYQQTEHMKNLKSQKLYCEVLETRKSQLKEKELQREKELQEKLEFQATLKEQLRQANLKGLSIVVTHLTYHLHLELQRRKLL
jgi:hypothetical protein